MDRKAMGKRINITRKEKGLTGEKLSELCNINATFLRQIEGGAKTPSLPVFITICQNLGVSADYLLAGDLLPDSAGSMEHLQTIMEKATPQQMKLTTAMILSALEALDEPQ